MIQLKPIAVVKNSRSEIKDDDWGDVISIIELDESMPEDALLEIEELDAIQWTPGVDKPQGGDPCWYDLYKRILAGGKSVMPSLVEVNELEPLLDAIGPHGVNVMVTFKTEQDIETAVKIAEKFR